MAKRKTPTKQPRKDRNAKNSSPGPVNGQGIEKPQVIDLANLSQFMPASVLNKLKVDPSDGVQDAPPNWGQQIVPQIATVMGRVTAGTQIYWPNDEALRHMRVNAQAMRNDCGIMECLEHRQRATAMLKWHIEPEDPQDTAQKEIAAELQLMLERIGMPIQGSAATSNGFLEYRRFLMEAIWYGRVAIQNAWNWQKIRGKMRCVPTKWIPINGDKLVFRWDDGSGTYEDGQIGIRVTLGGFPAEASSETVKQVEPADYSQAYMLRPYERELLTVHKHIIEDGPFEEPRDAGAIHGVGIRSRIYWTWYQMQNALAWFMEYMERSAFGIEVWTYPANNPQAQEATKQSALNRVGGGRTAIMVPVFPGEDSQQYGLRLVEPGLQGVELLKEVVHNFFFHKIKRYILGQTLTSEADATGMGSELATVHLTTFLDVVRFDAQKLGESITTDLVAPMVRYNFPAYRDVFFRFVCDTEAPETEKKLEALAKAWQMGLKIKSSDVYALLGISPPDITDEVLGRPEPGAGVLQDPNSPQAGQQMEKSEEVAKQVLNGAQVTAAMNIVASVSSGEVPRDSGIQQLQNFFGLDQAAAEQIMGSAGNGNQQPTNDNPSGGLDIPQDQPNSTDEPSGQGPPIVDKNAKWDESKHPRAEDGKFGEGQGGTGEPSKKDGEVDKGGSGTSKADSDSPGSTKEGKRLRFEAGKSLTTEERKEVLQSLSDVYRDNGLKKDRVVGYNHDGDPIYGYPIRPDLFIRSDITGKPMRHFVTLKDGTKAHPSELFGISQADVERAISKAEIEAGNAERSAKITARDKVARISQEGDKQKANQLYHKTRRDLGGSYFMANKEGHIVRVDGNDAKDVEYYKEMGFEQISQPAPSPAIVDRNARRITIGAKKNAEPGKKGGFPIQIDDDGKILKGGPKGLQGKHVSEIGDYFKSEKEGRTKRGKKRFDEDFSSRSWSKVVEHQAERWGITPAEYEDVSKDVWEDKSRQIESREQAREDARKRLGVTAGDVGRLENKGIDSGSKSSIKGLDTVGRSLASEYPELGWGGGYGSGDDVDYGALAWDLIREGKQTAPSRTSAEFHEAVEEYLEYTMAEAGKDWKPDYDVPDKFQRQRYQRGYDFALRMEVADAASDTQKNVTDKQRASGRYRKGRVTLHGLPIAIENPIGSVRSGTKSNGDTWRSLMTHHYGYFVRTESGADGDEIDVFIGPNPESELVVVVNQNDPKTGRFDEHKVVMGADDVQQAIDIYDANYGSDWEGRGYAVGMTLERFKEWLKTADTSKPATILDTLDGTELVRSGPTAIGSATADKNAKWDESKHPRAEDGKFGEGGGGAKTAPEKPSGGAKELPRNVRRGDWPGDPQRHREDVEWAVLNNKPVSEEVLADYPELKEYADKRESNRKKMREWQEVTNKQNEAERRRLAEREDWLDSDDYENASSELRESSNRFRTLEDKALEEWGDMPEGDEGDTPAMRAVDKMIAEKLIGDGKMVPAAIKKYLGIKDAKSIKQGEQLTKGDKVSFRYDVPGIDFGTLTGTVESWESETGSHGAPAYGRAYIKLDKPTKDGRERLIVTTNAKGEVEDDKFAAP